MTPDQAATLIRAAWNAPENDTDFALSDRIAVALNSIGLLAFASDPQAAHRRHSEVDPNAQAGTGSLNTEHSPGLSSWASQRKRP